MTLKEKIAIVRKTYPEKLDNQSIPPHIVQIFGTYEEIGGLTGKMMKVLDKVVERLLKGEK